MFRWPPQGPHRGAGPEALAPRRISDRITMTEFLSDPTVQRLGLLLGGLLLGILSEKAVFSRLRKFAKRTKFQWDNVLAESFKGVPALWLTAGGAYLALGVGSVDAILATVVLKGLTVLLIGSIVIASMRAVGATMELVSASSAIRSPTLVVNLARLAVGVLGAFIILQNLDIQITPLVTAFGIGGLAVALALQDTLGNLFAGVQIILSGQVRPHDYIQLASGDQGYVTDVKGRNTTIHTFPDGNLVVVPNSTLASSIVKNYSMPRAALWVSTEVGVSYDSDLEHVEAVTLEVARDVLSHVEGGVTTDSPIVLFHTFGDSSINFEVRMMVREFTDQGRVRHEFIKKLHHRFNEEGIEIPFPIRTLMTKGESSPI